MFFAELGDFDALDIKIGPEAWQGFVDTNEYPWMDLMQVNNALWRILGVGAVVVQRKKIAVGFIGDGRSNWLLEGTIK